MTVNHQYHASYENIMLRPLERKDIENLRVWRNDATQTRFLRKIDHITPEMQEKWYESYLKDNDTIAFAIEETEHLHRMVGSLSLYDFQGEQAEIGRLQVGDMEARGHGIGGKSFVLAMMVAFRKMGLRKIVASVHQENQAAYKSYLKIGFQVCGSHPASVGGIEDEIWIDEKRLTEVNGYTEEIKM